MVFLSHQLDDPWVVRLHAGGGQEVLRDRVRDGGVVLLDLGQEVGQGRAGLTGELVLGVSLLLLLLLLLGHGGGARDHDGAVGQGRLLVVPRSGHGCCWEDSKWKNSSQ